LVKEGKPVRESKTTKKIAAVKNRKKMRQKGEKLWRAIFVTTKESPQKKTAVANARYVRNEFWALINVSFM
jgi:hypothetical protein